MRRARSTAPIISLYAIDEVVLGMTVSVTDRLESDRLSANGLATLHRAGLDLDRLLDIHRDREVAAAKRAGQKLRPAHRVGLQCHALAAVGGEHGDPTGGGLLALPRFLFAYV